MTNSLILAIQITIETSLKSNFTILHKLIVLSIVLTCLITSSVLAQSQSRLGKLFEKKKYEVFKKTLAKSMLKDAINPEAHYWYSVFYLKKGLKTYDIEQSYESILTSELDYKALADEKVLVRLSKYGIDSLTIDIQKRKIELAAFERAKDNNTEDGYNYFLNHFTGALQSDSVIVLRNAVAFQKARELNTHDSYRRFMKTYPEAQEIPEARKRFERLYFDESTKDDKLRSYVKFLSDHPKTHYRSLAEKQIFELSTLSGNPQDYINFITKYRKSSYVRHAMDILYHLNQSLLKYEWAPDIADSLKKVSQMDDNILVAFYKHEKFGFINTKGLEIIAPIIDEIAAIHKCEVVANSIIEAKEKGRQVLYNKMGDKIWSGEYEELEDIGKGILVIYSKGKAGVIHKSGRQILPLIYDKIELIGNRMIGYKDKGKWGLASFIGRIISPPTYDKIIGLEQYLLVSNKGNIGLLPYSAINKVANGKPLSSSYQYSDWELLSNGDLIVSDDQTDYILSHDLKLRFNELVKKIDIHDSLFITTEPSGHRLYDTNYKLIAGPFEAIKYNKSIIAYEQEDRWLIMSDSIDISYDSLMILSDKIAVGHHGGTSFFIFNNSQSLEVPEDIHYRILKNIKSIDHTHSEFLVLNNEDNYKYIYNESSRLIYEGVADKFHLIGIDLIVIEEKGLKGIINGQGKELVPPEYEAIGNFKDGLVSLLIDSQFGLYRVSDSTIVPAEYDKQLQSYHQGFFIAHKEEGYGLINKYNETVIPFEFEEIRYWNDTAAFIKKDFDWKLYNIRSNEIIYEHIKHFEVISTTSDEIIAKVLIDNNFGLMSNTRGTIIPAVYQDIQNFGSKDIPFYMAEKNIEEADFYVAIYYNAEGEIVYKQAYEAADFDKIYCEGN